MLCGCCLAPSFGSSLRLSVPSAPTAKGICCNSPLCLLPAFWCLFRLVNASPALRKKGVSTPQLPAEDECIVKTVPTYANVGGENSPSRNSNSMYPAAAAAAAAAVLEQQQQVLLCCCSS